MNLLRRLFHRLSATSPGNTVSAEQSLASKATLPHVYFNQSTRPYTRWWWLQGPFREEDIIAQLDWLKANGFGGVEIAWLAPHWMGARPPGPPWLSGEWSKVVAFTSKAAAERSLGCDLTFGSCWPFGGSCVPESDSAQTFNGYSPERLEGSWEDFDEVDCHIVNHLRSDALGRYADALLRAMRPALQRQRSALFCDSLEIDTKQLWSEALWDRFAARFGYRLEPYTDRLYAHPDMRYDYRVLIAETMVQEFYEAFTAICHDAGVFSRVQCHGSPTDLLAAYAAVDIPESETLLFEPHFSRIPASAATLAGKPVVSAETFTCIYGFSHFRTPELYRSWKQEQITDLKLLADASIANGVNQIVWHGMPYNPPGGNNEFYAAVHVGPDSGLAEAFRPFNQYLTTVCQLLQAGRTFTQLAVYLPNEDNWMADRIPESERTPGATYRWQMRHVRPPSETAGYHPLWISLPFLQQAAVQDKRLSVGDARFDALYIDCEWLDMRALRESLRLGCEGLPIVIKRRPTQPGHRRSRKYDSLLRKLLSLPNTLDSLEKIAVTPFLQGADLPLYWARETDDAIFLFLAHPDACRIRYPMQYRQSERANMVTADLDITTRTISSNVRLSFQPYQSMVLQISHDGKVQQLDTDFRP